MDYIKFLTKEYATDAALLHQQMIPTAFLSKLGFSFLKQLYKAIGSAPSGFGFVHTDEKGEVLGFIACSENTGKLYKQALLRRGILMSLPILKYIIRPSFIKRMIKTLRYPSQIPDELPAAEVLSIAVSEKAHGKGVGKALMEAGLSEFQKRNITKVKVAVWSENIQANKFYEKCGFKLALTRKHHGLDMNVYVIDL